MNKCVPSLLATVTASEATYYTHAYLGAWLGTPEAGQTPWHSEPPSPAEAYCAAPVVSRTPSDEDADCPLPTEKFY